jgi:hypothetical protein
MKFLQTLSESRFLSSKGAFRKFSAKQIAELTYLHIIALRILQCESSLHDFAKDYASGRTVIRALPAGIRTPPTFTCCSLGIQDEDVELKMPEASKEFKENLYFDEGELQSWLKDVARGTENSRQGPPPVHAHGRHAPNQGRLDEGYPPTGAGLADRYNAQKKLAMTRLLQMLRLRARQSDLLVRLEAVATQQAPRTEERQQPETGDERVHDGADPNT